MSVGFLPDRDDSGRAVTKSATTDKGWSYIADCMEFETSKHGSSSIYHKDCAGTDRGQVTCKIYDASNNEITLAANEANAVKSVFTFTTGYDFDIIAGSVWQNAKPSVDVRMWTEGGIIALGAAGMKTFVNGLNLRHIEGAKTDGRSSKKLFHDHEVEGVGTFEGDNLVFTLLYPVGTSHKTMLMVEYYRL